MHETHERYTVHGALLNDDAVECGAGSCIAWPSLDEARECAEGILRGTNGGWMEIRSHEKAAGRLGWVHADGTLVERLETCDNGTSNPDECALIMEREVAGTNREIPTCEVHGRRAAAAGTAEFGSLR